MTELAGAQLSLIADKAEDSPRPYSDWEIDCRPPVQSRSIEQIRRDAVVRAKGGMPKPLAPNSPQPVGDYLPAPNPNSPQPVGDYLPAPNPSSPQPVGDYSTVPNPSSPQPVGDYLPAPTPNSPQPVGDYAGDRPIDPPKLDRKWNKGHEYYYLRPYIDGKRESFYLGRDIDRAHAKSIAIALRVAAGRSKAQIVADLEREFPKRSRSYSMMVA
jgi:hypothetical protein